MRLDLKRHQAFPAEKYLARPALARASPPLVLAGLMGEDAAAALVFGMHNEYAFDDLGSGPGHDSLEAALALA